MREGFRPKVEQSKEDDFSHYAMQKEQRELSALPINKKRHPEALRARRFLKAASLALAVTFGSAAQAQEERRDVPAPEPPRVRRDEGEQQGGEARRPNIERILVDGKESTDELLLLKIEKFFRGFEDIKSIDIRIEENFIERGSFYIGKVYTTVVTEKRFVEGVCSDGGAGWKRGDDGRRQSGIEKMTTSSLELAANDLRATPEVETLADLPARVLVDGEQCTDESQLQKLRIILGGIKDIRVIKTTVSGGEELAGTDLVLAKARTTIGTDSSLVENVASDHAVAWKTGERCPPRKRNDILVSSWREAAKQLHTPVQSETRR